MRQQRSLEQRLYEAFHRCTGIYLNSDDVSRLICLDDAIQARIVNTAAIEAGFEEPGSSIAEFGTLSWKQMQERLKD